MKDKPEKAFRLILTLIIGCIVCLLLLSMKTMLFLPEGELLGTFDSPNGSRSIQAYLCNGGATTDWAVRCEVKGSGVIDRTIYWQDHTSEGVVYWIDNNTVSINRILIDVRWECYDYRKAVS